MYMRYQKCLFTALFSIWWDPVAQWLRRWSLLATCVEQLCFLQVWYQPDYPGSNPGRVGKTINIEGCFWVCFRVSYSTPQIANKHVSVLRAIIHSFLPPAPALASACECVSPIASCASRGLLRSTTHRSSVCLRRPRLAPDFQSHPPSACAQHASHHARPRPPLFQILSSAAERANRAAATKAATTQTTAATATATTKTKRKRRRGEGQERRKGQQYKDE